MREYNIRDARLTQRGFTLLEMMISITLMMLLFAIIFPFFKSQVNAMNDQANLFESHQNVRFGSSLIERELRVAGAGVPSSQPMIVQADPYAITFNVDLTASSASGAGHFGAVYLDEDISESATISLDKALAIVLPRSAQVYPDTNYYGNGGVRSYAETISFWIGADTSVSNRESSYALYRRVNDLPPEIIARGLVIDNTDPPTFRYMTLDANDNPLEIDRSRLPLFHVPVHGSAQDIDGSATTDSIRMVKIFLRARPDGKSTAIADRYVDANIRLLNAGLLKHITCGEAPVFNSAVTSTLDSTTKEVVLQWNKADDEGGGEKDVDRYLIFRKKEGVVDFTNPYASVAAGESSYTFRDGSATSGNWIYGVSAQDCGGQHSPVMVSPRVTVP